MKTFKFLMPFLLVAFALVGCDTDDLRNDIDELKNRVESLEAQVSAFNDNINALKVLIDGKLTIQEVKEENGVYTLLLSNEQTITLKQGDDFSAPQEPEVTIENGNWVINGTDTGCSVADDVPEFRIKDSYWEVKIDGNWKSVKDANGNDVKAVSDGTQTGNSFFESVEYNKAEGVLSIVLKKDSQPLTLPVVQNLLCAIDKASLKNGNTLVVGYGKTAELAVTIKGDNAFVTAPSGWIATLSEPGTDGKATLTVKAPAKANASTMSRATADNSKDLTVQVNKGVNWAVDKIQVEAGEVIESYYELFDSGQMIEIAGVKLKKTDWDENFTVKQITPDKNGTDDNKIISDGIYFVSAGAIANLDMPLTAELKLSSNKNLYIFRDNSNDNTAKLIVSRQVMLNNADATSRFLCEGLSIDATSIVNDKNASTYMMGLGGDFGEVIFKNCAIKVRTDKTFAYISAAKTLKNLHFENCKFNMTGRTQKQYFNLPAPTITVVTLKNNIFYAGTADSHTTDVPLKMFTFTDGKAETLNMENNSFVNTVPLTDGFIACKTVSTIHIKNNLFYSSEYKNNNNLIRYDNDSAEDPQIPQTVVSANNYANKGSKIWRVFYSNGISEGSEQVNCNNETIFKTMDFDKVVFKPIDELSAYGATIE